MGRPWGAVRQTVVRQAAPVRKVITKASPVKGAGKGKGSGSWVFVPHGANISTVISKMQRGRPAPAQKKPVSKFEEKLRGIDSTLKVWIGGLSAETTWKDLEKHFATVAKPSITEIRKNGTAVAAYKTVEDVEAAVAGLNGTELKGNILEVDVWVQKPKFEKIKVDKEPTPKSKVLPVKGSLVKKMPVKQVVAKAAPKAKGKAKAKAKAQNDKMKEKLAAVPANLKVWVGGLPEGTTWKELHAHMSTVTKPKLSHIHRSAGICVFETEEDVTNAIAMLDGTELNGNRLQVDTWTRPEKKVKVKEQPED